MRVPWRREFDPARKFVVRKPLSAGGRKFAAGETFDPALVTVRRLRQLFDQHTLVFEGDTPGKMIRDYRRHPREVLERQRVLASGGPALPGPDELEGAPAPEEPPRAARPARQEPAAPPARQEPPPPPAPTPEAQAAAAERARRSAIEIPQDWERQPWNTVRVLAKEIDPSTAIGNKDTAMAVIADEIAHRAGDS